MAYYYSPFRKEYSMKQDSGSCPFCNSEVIRAEAVRDSRGKIIENNSYVWLVNFYPKFEGHTLIVPKRHITNLEGETNNEALDRRIIVKTAVKTVQKTYPGSGVEIFLQFGPGSEASIKHLHWHIVPALPDDPIRGFGKLGHFFTKNETDEMVLRFPIKIQYARESLQDVLSKSLNEDG